MRLTLALCALVFSCDSGGDAADAATANAEAPAAGDAPVVESPSESAVDSPEAVERVPANDVARAAPEAVNEGEPAVDDVAGAPEEPEEPVDPAEPEPALAAKVDSPEPAAAKGAVHKPRTAKTGCTTDRDCGEGSRCEGEGCDRGQGTCMPNNRRCTRDAVQYCSCDGETFRASSQCPLRRFEHRGACRG